ncbi:MULTISPECIES: helix-turn-helix transcriptional regulator [unclassified Herbaspirillum]|uniref:helix-turn-helix transcriptional regulator n=1 Tax=unclassified Herbaspirillum TaxID=2624150 RepID=UPI000E2E7F1B|nr:MULTISPECIES: helix-turn-helix transcriptional regulator [unclassified Herbaspirillum]RFB73839.1 XRE family transcriptional regulator [Herbaspirillum sp. 3R-3a1]TFI10350.1 XRE family transcriptional regulator [Herbaspirillum sp. 3R11]TFI16254.1 XRE family transcriptional regulator [Herbaspirillum sp. 3R-11]TFI28351.1 XRE family transcriptional regulator [Herbaspirillum sp. 3C11]
MSKHVGTIIKQRLKSLQKTQGWLAEQASVSNTAVSKWIATGNISRAKAKEVAIILQISLDALLSEDTESEAAPAQSLSLIYVTADEMRMLTSYREASVMGRALIEAAIDSAPKAESVNLIARNNKP